MLSKNQVKLIRGLSQKKIRQQLGLFIVEGVKGIGEFLNSDFVLDQLFTTQMLFEVEKHKVTQVTEAELKSISALKSPNIGLAIFKIPKPKPAKQDGLIIALDAIRDPGNLGTIIRLCDWYGVEELICSVHTVDCYNPKVVQASMGSLARVSVQYLDLDSYISASKLPVFGTFMTGDNIYTTDLPAEGIVILGNEANGISEELQTKIHQQLTIPQFGTQKTTESLNVANATAIVLSEFRRRIIER